MTSSEPVQDASPAASAATLPRWTVCLVVGLVLIVWAELAGLRDLLFARGSVTTWGWIRAGALYGALALVVLVLWDRVVPLLRATRFWVVVVALIAVVYQPVWLTEDLPKRLGISGGDLSRQIDTVRTVRPTVPPVPFVATSQQRFGGGVQAPVDLRDMFRWETPAGWREVAVAKEGRVVTFVPPDANGAECYVSVLRGGGELLDNLNRWRNQLGQAPLSATQVAALPTLELLGRPTPLLEVAGSYRGPTDAVARPGTKLLAVCLTAPQALITVKMIGPAAVVDAQRAGFEQIVGSLGLSDHGNQAASQTGSQGSPTSGREPPASGTNDPSPRQSPLSWSAPAHWKRARDRFGREVTFEAGAAECWISLLGGDGGGVRGNVDRWRGQMGLPPLSAGQTPSLETFEMLGQTAQRIELEGAGEQAGKSMVVVFGPFETASVFVKITGATEAVHAEREAFETFCRSLRRAP